MVLVFGMILIGCSTESSNDDDALTGTWCNDGLSIELTISNGNWEMVEHGNKIRKGIYTTNGENITITVTSMCADYGEWLDIPSR